MVQAVELIDADAHVNPPPTFWDEYLPRELAGQGPQIEEGIEEDGHDWVVFEGTRKPLNVMSSVVSQGRNFRPNGRRSEIQAGSWEPTARLVDMARDGVSRAVMFGGGPLGTANSELYIASFEAYNRWLWDFCSVDRNRLVGVAYLPMRTVEETRTLLRQPGGAHLRLLAEHFEVLAGAACLIADHAQRAALSFEHDPVVLLAFLDLRSHSAQARREIFAPHIVRRIYVRIGVHQ